MHLIRNIIRFQSSGIINFKPKKVVILKKLTRYEFNKISHKDLSEDRLKTYLKLTGSDYEQLLLRHKEHYKKLDEVLKILEEKKIETKVVDRFGYKSDVINWADLIITAGGDGTFLLGASKIHDDKPIMGVNTDPLGSEGYLCLPRKIGIPDTMVRILNGEISWLWRQRISVRLGGANREAAVDSPMELHEIQLQYPEYRFLEHVKEGEEAEGSVWGVGGLDNVDSEPKLLPYHALNEVFVGESLSARVSYYEISVDGSNSQKQKSSGVTVCTGTGSSSWSFHINHVTEDCVENLLNLAAREGNIDKCELLMNNRVLVKNVTRRYNSQLCFSPEEPRMAYTIRDPIRNKIFHVSHPQGFASRIRIKSRMWDAHVVIDGGVSYKFNDGAVVQLEINPKYALRCVNLRGHSMRPLNC